MLPSAVSYTLNDRQDGCGPMSGEVLEILFLEHSLKIMLNNQILCVLAALTQHEWPKQFYKMHVH